MANPKHAGARLRAWRESQVITGRAFARLLNTNPTSLSDWESGECVPRLLHLLMVQAICGISIESWLSPDEAEQLRRLIEEWRAHRATIVPPAPGAVSP